MFREATQLLTVVGTFCQNQICFESRPAGDVKAFRAAPACPRQARYLASQAGEALRYRGLICCSVRPACAYRPLALACCHRQPARRAFKVLPIGVSPNVGRGLPRLSPPPVAISLKNHEYKNITY
jgi:hypothetical protein